jgi:hypothetical protein
MTEAEAREEAKRRNADKAGGLRVGDAVWLPVEQESGNWTLEEYAPSPPARRSRLGQALGYLVEGLP